MRRCHPRPSELARSVADAEAVRTAIGARVKQCGAGEAANRHASRRGVFAARHLDEGHVVRDEDVVMLRPETAVAARAWPDIIGRRLRRGVAAGVPLAIDDLD